VPRASRRASDAPPQPCHPYRFSLCSDHSNQAFERGGNISDGHIAVHALTLEQALFITSSCCCVVTMDSDDLPEKGEGPGNLPLVSDSPPERSVLLQQAARGGRITLIHDDLPQDGE
jgi:hypothetical protein